MKIRVSGCEMGIWSHLLQFLDEVCDFRLVVIPYSQTGSHNVKRVANECNAQVDSMELDKLKKQSVNISNDDCGKTQCLTHNWDKLVSCKRELL